MSVDTPPPIEPAIHREAPEMPQALGAQNENSEYIVTVEETPEQKQKRVEREEAQLMNKTTEIILGYIIKQGLFVDKEPEVLLSAIRESELFKKKIQPLVETACEGENGNETTPTSVSPFVSVRTEKDGDVIETVHGFHIQPSATLLNDPETPYDWKHDYIFDFQDPEVWQGLFPGSEPTLLQQEEADQILTEAESTAKEIQDDFKKTGGYFEPTPERLAKADTILKSLNIDAEEFAASLTDIHDLQGLLLPDVLAPKLVDAKKIKEMALLALTRDNVHPNDLQKYLNDFQKSNQAMNGFKSYIESVPEEKRRDTDFFIGFKKQFGEDKLKTLLRFKNAFTGDISDQSVNTDLDHVNRFEKAQDETE